MILAIVALRNYIHLEDSFPEFDTWEELEDSCEKFHRIMREEQLHSNNLLTDPRLFEEDGSGGMKSFRESLATRMWERL